VYYYLSITERNVLVSVRVLILYHLMDHSIARGGYMTHINLLRFEVGIGEVGERLGVAEPNRRVDRPNI
jgi:hypothetical protein